MRNIEFRGKATEDTDNANKGEWVTGYLFEDQTGDFLNEIGAIGIIGITYAGNNAFMAVDPETVGEYTGLKDKNDKKIFEGDIVLRRNTESNGIENKHKHLVVFEKGCFSIRAIDSFYRYTVHKGLSPNAYSLHDDYMGLQKLTSEYPIVNGSFEVIGNIFDNGELLNEPD